MKKIRMRFPNEKTFREGFEEYILDCKARNLRDGTINHYQESIKQIYKRITPDTLISSMCQQTMANFYISLRDDLGCYEQVMGEPGKCLVIGGGTYAHFLKNGVAFGASRLGVDYHIHGANEYLVADEIVRSAELFALTIVALCGEHAEPM